MRAKKPPRFIPEDLMAAMGLKPCEKCGLPDSPMKWKVYHTPEHPCPHEPVKPEKG